MKITSAMKKRIDKLNTDTFEIADFTLAWSAKNDLLKSGLMIEGQEKENIHGVMCPTYKLIK